MRRFQQVWGKLINQGCASSRKKSLQSMTLIQICRDFDLKPNHEDPESMIPNRSSARTASISKDRAGSVPGGDFDHDHCEPQPVATMQRYVIDRQIGKGGMGLVYHAYDSIFDREVAIKVLLKNYQGRDEARQRFFQEARTTARLQHPGIVSVYDMGISDDGQPFFAMKLVEGRTLSELMKTENKTQLQHSRLLDVFARVCQTIAYAHAHQTVHLDIKPSNVMVGAYGEVHVMDWGLSRQMGKSPIELTPISPAAVENISDEQLSMILSNSKIIGTPSYMAPEQARGHHISVRSDVFGLGALLCEILTGKPPYEGSSFRRIYRRAARGSIHKTYQRLDACDADPAIIALAKRCLAPNERDRPADAGTIAAQITAYVESSMERAQRDLCRFFELSMDLFCIASLDGYFKRVNSNFSRVLGYSDSELISKPFIEFIHPDDIRQTIQAISTLAQGDSIAAFCNRYRDSGGNYRWFQWNAKSIPQDNTIFAVARVIDPPDD
ncbi:Serine/threonine-protein kinase PknD [Stieleria magnilauensis]|uniref:Serine/threonine-protein kinase PknD n=2 Tax=Stieleria magnilauensis TaxID=2527963 RepID=A0ABX5Y4M0_9BACT|nr:Serine/threonine-protein kinase PknD [Planctomycetes bacterium TBK1r]